jgi:hypothetical protein
MQQTIKSKMRTLPSNYHAEIDCVSESEWSELLQQFDDASIYQTWSYGAVRWSEDRLSHLILKRDEEVVGLAQASILKLGFLGAGIAYIPWGPVWERKGVKKDPNDIREMIRTLREEYANRRGLLLRMTPNETEGGNGVVERILNDEEFRLKSRPYRTLLIDLSQSMEELRKGSARRWRRALKTAEEKKLKLIDGTGDELFEILFLLYKEMVARKGFIPGVDMNEFRVIQKALPDPLKMKIMVCECEGKPISALAASLIGNKGVGLLGATGTTGLNLGGFHLLNWRMIEWMKRTGARYYDFGGYNPEENAGTAGFKDGLPGKDVSHIGQYEACVSLISSLLVRTGDKLRISLRKTKRMLFNPAMHSPSIT